MLKRISRGIDLIAQWLAYVAMVLLVFLVSCILFEVVSRRFFNSPTIWAFDLSMMTNGALFVLALALILQRNQHICIDFLSHRFSDRFTAIRDTLFYGLGFFPVLAVLAYVAWDAAIEAMRTGRVDRVSPWAPLMWPYLSALAIGLTALLLQTMNLLLHAMARFQTNSSANNPP